MLLSEIKIGEPIVVVGNVDALIAGNYVAVDNLTAWTIEARTQSGLTFVRSTGLAPNSYGLTLATVGLPPGELSFDVKLRPPGGAAFFSDTYRVRLVQSATP